MAIAAAMAVVSAVSAYSQSEQQRQQQNYQADVANYQASVARNNAQALRYEADNERRKGEIEQENINRERDQLRRKYESEAGANRSLLAASGVDMASGSAADMLMGNANYFAGDVQVNRYNHAVAGWEADERARKTNYQASLMENQADANAANASWLKRTSGNLGMSLLTAGIKGVSSGLSTYGAMGGFAGGAGKVASGVGSSPAAALSGAKSAAVSWKW